MEPTKTFRGALAVGDAVQAAPSNRRGSAKFTERVDYYYYTIFVNYYSRLLRPIGLIPRPFD
jgi:hypothetical protein